MVSDSWNSLLTMVAKIGQRADDAEDLRLQKSLLVFGSFMFISAGALWGVIYILFGEPMAGMIPLSYAIISALSVLHFGLTRRYRIFRASQLVLILFLPFFLMMALGGFINSSAVILWSFICPLGALLFAEYKQSPRWLTAYLVLVIISGVIQPYFNTTNNLPEWLVTTFFVLNIGAVSTIAFVLMHYFVGEKELAYRLLRVEQGRSESLLLNVLPQEIAVRLKDGEQNIADYYPSVSILFADLVGFTPLTSQLSPSEMVQILNMIYSHFDTLIEAFGAEKMRTIGDSYMIASGLPRAREDHAQILARLALEMNRYIAQLPPVGDQYLSFRIGINSGPVIAGVIGQMKFAYDVWGDTVNIASRMESHGTPGRIQITQATYELIQNDFLCEPGGLIDVKGKGMMEIWFLVDEIH